MGKTAIPVAVSIPVAATQWAAEVICFPGTDVVPLYVAAKRIDGTNGSFTGRVSTTWAAVGKTAIPVSVPITVAVTQRAAQVLSFEYTRDVPLCFATERIHGADGSFAG